MASPQIIPAPINRLIASVIFTNFTGLNITPSVLLPEAIDLNFGGPFTTNIPALTSVVPSGEPYVPVELMAHIIRTSSLAALFKTQMETSTFLGPCSVQSDAITLGIYQFQNMSITKLDRLVFSGRDAGFAVTIAGAYQINSANWP